MNTSDELNALRLALRDWLSDHAPQDWREQYRAGSHGDYVEAQRQWFRALVKGGYAIPHWTADWAGGGKSLTEQKIIYEEFARADTPRLLLYFVSLYHAYSTLMECGSKAQQTRYLPRILDGEVWCQGFSEPNAGSDLASLKTRAERRSSEGREVYVVNGQKVWSTMAQYADRCLLLVRTSSEGPRQAGITCLLLDMKAKGVSIRPIHQIQGDEEFCEIFLDDVEVPVDDRIGDENGGWSVAQSTLSSERGLTLMELTYRLRGALWRMTELIVRGGFGEDQGILRDFGALVARVDSACAISDQYLQSRIAGTEHVADASIVKNIYSRVLREYALLGTRLGGIEEQCRAAITYGELTSGNWMADFMNSYAWTIAGGSEEVQRNIIAERILDMPREPKGWVLA